MERYIESNPDYKPAGNAGGTKGSVQVWGSKVFTLGKTAHDAFHEKLDALSGLPGNEIIDERDVTNMDHLIQPYFSQSRYSTCLRAITTYLWSFLHRPGSTDDLALKQLKANDARSRGELYVATWETVQDALEKTGF